MATNETPTPSDDKAKAAAEAAELADHLKKLGGYYTVEIPGCCVGRKVVQAHDEDEALDRFTAWAGVTGYDKPPVISKIEGRPDVCDLPREPDVAA